VNLKLQGIGADGAPFEIVTHTENVSASGFRCICTVQLQAGSMVTVFAVNDQEQRVGKARVVWVESRNAAWPIAGFRFVEKPHLWVL
jgi:ribosomal protein S12